MVDCSLIQWSSFPLDPLLPGSHICKDPRRHIYACICGHITDQPSHQSIIASSNHGTGPSAHRDNTEGIFAKETRRGLYLSSMTPLNIRRRATDRLSLSLPSLLGLSHTVPREPSYGHCGSRDGKSDSRGAATALDHNCG